MSGVIMESEDYIAILKAEVGSLNEELVRERARREAAEKGEELAIASGLQWQRKYNEAHKQLQSWADYADEENKLAALRQPGAAPKWEVPRDVSDDYRKHMLSEMKKDIVNSKTKQVEQRWVKIGGRPNHLWDCECIALASAMLAGVMPVGTEN